MWKAILSSWQRLLKGNYNWFWKNSVTSPSCADYKYVVFTFIFTLEPPWKSHFSHLRGLGSMKKIFFWKRDIWIFHKILIFWFFFDVFFHSNHHSNSQTSHILYKHTMAILNRIWFWVSFLLPVAFAKECKSPELNYLLKSIEL